MDGAKACVIVNVKELLTNVLGLAYMEVLTYLSSVNHLNLFIMGKQPFMTSKEVTYQLFADKRFKKAIERFDEILEKSEIDDLDEEDPLRVYINQMYDTLITLRIDVLDVFEPAEPVDLD